MKRKSLSIVLIVSIFIIGASISIFSGSLSDSNPVEPKDSLTVEKNFTSDKYEYLESKDEVKHPHWSDYYQDGETKNYSVPKVVPAKQWREEECMTLARSKLAKTIEEQAERIASVDGIVFGMSSYTQLTVQHTTTKNREGEVISSPEISYEQLKSITPEKINCTVHIDGETYSNTVEVTAEKSSLQQL